MSMHKKKHFHLTREFIIQAIVVIVFSAFVIIDVGDLIHDYRQARQATPAPQSTLQLESWMTFNYVNFVYDLPPDYLRTTLHITDPRYPNVEIRHYAKRYGIDQNTLMHNIDSAINLYGVTS